MKTRVLLGLQSILAFGCLNAKSDSSSCQHSQECFQLEQAQDPVQKKINASISCLKKELACKLYRLKKEFGSSKSCQGGCPQVLPLVTPTNTIDDKTITTDSFKGKNGVLSNPLVITSPGYYIFSENIVFAPQVKGVSAILVQSDNVTIDLNGNTLSQSKTTVQGQVFDKTRSWEKHAYKKNKTNKYEQNRALETGALEQCIGIVIESGRKNVAIVGSQGSIEGFSQLGIQVQGGTEDIQIGTGSLLTIKNCGGLAEVPFLQADGTRFYEGGIQIGESHFLAHQKFPEPLGTVKGLRITNVHSVSNSLGIWLGNISDALIKDSSFSSNHDTRSFPQQVYGIELDVFSAGAVALLEKQKGDSGLENVVFEGCSFNGNTASTDKFLFWIGSRGLLLKNAHTNLILRKCSFNANTATGLNTNTVETCGCLLAGGQGTRIESCDFSGNSAGKMATGLYQAAVLFSAKDTYSVVPCSSLTVTNCSASNNLATGAKGLASGGLRQSYGFIFDSVDGATCVNCVAQNNSASVTVDPNSTSGRAVGLLFASKSDMSGVLYKVKNVSVRGFHASGNRTNCFRKGESLSAGIYICHGPGIEAISLQDSLLTDNGSSDPGLGYREEVGLRLEGFVPAQPDTSCVTLARCTISNHRSYGIHSTDFAQVTVLNSTISHNGTGLFLEKSPLCSVLNNTFLYNAQSAVQDADSQSTSLIAQNNSFSAINNTYKVSYLAPQGKFPVREGSLTTSFPQDAQIYDNIEVKQAPLPIKAPLYMPVKEFEKDDRTNFMQVPFEQAPLKEDHAAVQESAQEKIDLISVPVGQTSLDTLSHEIQTASHDAPISLELENGSQGKDSDTTLSVPSQESRIDEFPHQDAPKKEEGFFSGLWKAIKNKLCGFFCS